MKGGASLHHQREQKGASWKSKVVLVIVPETILKTVQHAVRRSLRKLGGS